VDTLRTRMRGLINELANLLPDDDARWYTFSLSAPGDPGTLAATVKESDATSPASPWDSKSPP
jgi:hypothetical protein